MLYYSYQKVVSIVVKIKQNKYLNELKKWRGKDVIKVLTGIRRCGKSTLLEQFQEELKQSGVKDTQIISLNFENMVYEDLPDYKTLYRWVTDRLHKTKTTYVFLDEIQMIPDFQKVVDSLYIKKNVDLYIAGSSAYLLSGELATLLSGRYVEINMLPISFAEYSKIKGKSGDEAFAEYLQWGGFPFMPLLDNSVEHADIYLEGVYNTIIVKNIEMQQNHRESDPNKRKVTDILLLKNIARFLALSVGSPISIKKIADYIASTGRKVSQCTVNDYVESLVESYVFYPAERFDVVSKQLLKQNQRMYITDLGLRRYLLSQKEYDLEYSLENVVFLELIRRGYTVRVGKVGSAKIDFVAQKNERIFYYQVTASMTDTAAFFDEMTPLRAVNDNYPKTILTLNHFMVGDCGGIEIVNVVDWLGKVDNV